jgi:hypothetical protein
MNPFERLHKIVAEIKDGYGEAIGTYSYNTEEEYQFLLKQYEIVERLYGDSMLLKANYEAAKKEVEVNE